MGVMPVYLDEKEIVPEKNDLQSALDKAEDILEERGRIVVEVKIDGELILGEAFDSVSEVDTEAKKIDFLSGDPSELADQALRELLESLDEVRTLQVEAAESFQQDLVQDAMAKIGTCIGVWQQVMQGIALVGPIKGIDIEVDEYEDKPILELVGQLSDRLIDLKEMIQAGDTLGMADVLAYEWPETINHWEKFIGWMLTSE